MRYSFALIVLLYSYSPEYDCSKIDQQIAQKRYETCMSIARSTVCQQHILTTMCRPLNSDCKGEN